MEDTTTSTVGNAKKHKQLFINYLNSLNIKSEYTSEDISILLKNINSFGVETEEYSKFANRAAQTLKKSIRAELEKYLEEFKNKYLKDEVIKKDDLEAAFTAYYLVTYYDREYEEMSKLGSTIKEYEDCFDDFALKYQIRGRYLRRLGKEKEALSCDKQAKEILTQKGITNVWVDITYASSISLLMEKRDRSLEKNDILSCIDSIRLAKEKHADYAKLYYLYAKLSMFSLVCTSPLPSYEESCRVIEDAKEELRTAIEKEDNNKDYYSLSVIEYKSYIRQADLILAEIRLNNSIKIQSDNVKADIEKRFSQQQAKSMEMLALFSSIVAIIVVAIGLFSKEYPLKSVLIAIVVMNACVLSVYSTLLLLLSNEEDNDYKKLWCILTLIASLGIVYKCVFLS